MPERAQLLVGAANAWKRRACLDRLDQFARGAGVKPDIHQALRFQHGGQLGKARRRIGHVMQHADRLDDVKDAAQFLDRQDIGFDERDVSQVQPFGHAGRVGEAWAGNVDRGDPGVRAVGVRGHDRLPASAAARDQHVERGIHEAKIVSAGKPRERLPANTSGWFVQGLIARIGGLGIMTSDRHTGLVACRRNTFH